MGNAHELVAGKIRLELDVLLVVDLELLHQPGLLGEVVEHLITHSAVVIDIFVVNYMPHGWMQSQPTDSNFCSPKDRCKSDSII